MRARKQWRKRNNAYRSQLNNTMRNQTTWAGEPAHPTAEVLIEKLRLKM